MDERDHYANTVIDEALREYPMAPLPSGFMNQVMAHVVSPPRMPVQERFRLQFIDIALPAFLVTVALAIYTIFLITSGRWEFAWLPAPQLNSMFVAPMTAVTLTRLGVLSALIVGEIALGFFVCVNLWSDRPYLIVDQS